MEATRICFRCIRRPRERGGSGSCPIPPSYRRPFEKADRDCSTFRLGDLRQKPPKPTQTDGLF